MYDDSFISLIYFQIEVILEISLESPKLNAKKTLICLLLGWAAIAI